jgi:DNA-binding beta-propeller fold protein YncE
MKKLNRRLLSPFRILVVILIYVIFLPFFASSEEIYKFERMWPTLQQPWYFFAPRETAIDSKGYIYVADTSNYRIVKLSSNGQFIKDWSFDNHQPYAIAIDGNDNVYVVVNHSD